MERKVQVLKSLRLFKVASSWTSTLLVFAVLAIALSELFIIYKSGIYLSIFVQNLAKLNFDGFKKALPEYLGWLTLSVTVLTLKLYICDRISIILRKTVVEKIHKFYFKENSFYDLLIYDSEIDNPDARITTDVYNWAYSFITILIALAQAPFSFCYYAYLVWKEIGYQVILVAIGFSILSMLLTRLLMSPIVKLTYKFEAANGDFRIAHVNIKENAETIALSRGQNAEKRLLAERFSSVLELQRKLANRSVFLNVVAQICRYFGNLLVYICLYFFSPTFEDPSSLLAFVSRVSFFVISVMSNITLFVTAVLDFSKLCGYADRVLDLFSILRDHNSLIRASIASNSILLSSVSISRPTGEPLIEDLTVSVKRGDSLFITGPSGAGKSSIFRVLGRLWPSSSGTVIVPDPNPSVLMLLTQHPYVPMVSASDCLCFPQKAEEFPSEVVWSVARFLKIEHLLQRPEETWSAGLSPGERQRVALARVLIHRPQFVLLDEATSAVPQLLEESIFAKFQELGITCVTIAHNQNLKQFHKQCLVLDGEGSYALYRNE